MIKGAIALLVTVVASVIAYCVYFICATHPVHAMMKQPEPEMEWLRREFALSDAEFARIQTLHAAYRPTCDEMCRKIMEANTRLEQAIESNTAMNPEVDEAMRMAAQVQQECRHAMLTHIYAVGAEMNPASARRYLTLMKPRLIEVGLPAATAVSADSSSQKEAR